MQVFQLSNDTRIVDVNLGATGLNTTAMALELLGFGETAFTSVSQADIQDIGSDLYRITFTEAQVNREGFLLFSLTGTGFDPFIGILFTVTTVAEQDPISGIPLNRDGFLPVKTFSGITPVLGLVVADFNSPSTTTFKKADELNFVTKTVVQVLEPKNEFGTARGIHLIQFVASDLNRIGDFTYKITGAAYDDFELQIQITEPQATKVIFEVRDTSPGIISPVPKIPISGVLTAFIGTTVPVNLLDFVFDQFGFGYADLTFEYFNGTIFTPLVVTDTTLAFTKNGTVTWELPGDQVVGGPGAPNPNDFFIKVEATAVAGDAELTQVDSGVVIAGVTLTVLTLAGQILETLLTSDLGRATANIIPGDYRVVLQKNDNIFSFNNVQVIVLEPESADLSQVVILEGEDIVLADPTVDPTLILLKTDLTDLEGNPVQRQEIRLEHRFLPVFFSGSKTILGRTVPIITDEVGHAELLVTAGATIDVFLTNTHVSRTIQVPLPRSGTGDTVGTAPTIEFKVTAAGTFLATDVQGIITISGVDHVISKVIDDQNIEVSPAIATDLVGAAWSIKKIDIFSLVALAVDQFGVAIPTFENFAIRTTLP